MGKRALNHMENRVEAVVKCKCPRCSGFGAIAADRGDSCWVCNGFGEVWRNNSTGFTIHKHKQPVTGFYY